MTIKIADNDNNIDIVIDDNDNNSKSNNGKENKHDVD